MFLIDNDLVRAGWSGAKGVVTDLIAKHGGSVLTARRWAERKLAYPVRHRRRGTYLLCYYEMPVQGISGLVRELDISESVLRYLLLAAEEVPEKERELAQLEQASDFIVPEPPPDDMVDSTAFSSTADDEEEEYPDIDVDLTVEPARQPVLAGREKES
jgi:small subunit ribosomal protein S6